MLCVDQLHTWQEPTELEASLRAALKEGGDDLQPVNVDLNLVQSLLASYGAQQGLPGPAGNLATALGLQMHMEDQKPPNESDD